MVFAKVGLAKPLARSSHLLVDYTWIPCLLPLTTWSVFAALTGLGMFLASYRSMTNSSPTSVRLRKIVCAGSSITLSARSFGRITRKVFTNFLHSDDSEVLVDHHDIEMKT